MAAKYTDIKLTLNSIGPFLEALIIAGFLFLMRPRGTPTSLD